MSTAADKEMQDTLMKDPRVQEALAKAGKDAMQDPAVQAEMIKVAKEKGPEMAAQVQAKISAWAQDPEVQAKAKEYANVALAKLGEAGSHVVALIEQGPTGVRVLAFGCGVASCVNAVMSVINPLALITGPIMYLISFYQLIFAFTTVIFEAKPEWVQKVGPVGQYQDMLTDKAKFLTEVAGRGMFYVFQGSLWLCFVSLAEPLDLICGLALCFIGTLHILMHFGIMPQHVVAHARTGYQRLSENQQPAASA